MSGAATRLAPHIVAQLATPVAAFVFRIASFANAPPMQMRVMKYGEAAPELAATATFSAFNIANAVD